VFANVFDQRAAINRMLSTVGLLKRDANGLELRKTAPGRLRILTGNVRSGTIGFDCGASLGSYTREGLLAGARLVVAIEAGAENLGCLRRTLAREIADGRVIVHPKGVWDREENRMMSLHLEGSGRDSVVFSYKDSRQEITVPLTTIDKLVTELHLKRVDFIKMDIEGAEQRALAGARETLARFKPRLAISGYHLPDDTVRIPEIVRRAQPGYRFECGECVVVPGRIAPETLFFR
jgi:FkbM family methyltransferase